VYRYIYITINVVLSFRDRYGSGRAPYMSGGRDSPPVLGFDHDIKDYCLDEYRRGGGNSAEPWPPGKTERSAA